MKGLPAGPFASESDFKRWHCKMEHGFGFCFLIEYEDEMKKTLVTAGRRQITNFFLCFALFYFNFFLLFFSASQRRSHCV